MTRAELYDESFYARQDSGSLASARRIVPILKERFSPSSVIDIGCGTGTWLSAWKDVGVDVLVGVDGDHVDISALRSSAIQFVVADLQVEFPALDRSFDLAMSLEVAEHISSDRAAELVTVLCAAADVVVFSAAIPGQLGTGHINPQPQSYWVAEFAAQGYGVLDVVRPIVWGDPNIDYWYRQNILVFRRGTEPTTTIIDIVHPETLNFSTSSPASVRNVRDSFAELVSAIQRSLGRRLKPSGS